MTQVAKQMAAQEMIPNAYYFLLAAKWQGITQIKAGEYRIKPDVTPQMILEQLARGQVWLHKITFPEGWTFQQILAAMQADANLAHTVDHQSFDQIMALIDHAGEHPEGMFYPDTYLFTKGTKDVRILRIAYDLMQKKLNQAWAKRALGTPYKTAYEALIVASLIEKETGVAKERPQIAGVILKRLQIGMRLQIDAAVIYGLTDKKLRLSHADLLTDSPYNTYTQSGLPPTPIAMPGQSSIQAALHPVMGDALYYVAKGDGSHVFSANLQQHNIAAQQYRQLLKDEALQRSGESEQAYLQPTDERVKVCVSGRLLLHYLAAF